MAKIVDLDEEEKKLQEALLALILAILSNMPTRQRKEHIMREISELFAIYFELELKELNKIAPAITIEMIPQDDEVLTEYMKTIEKIIEGLEERVKKRVDKIKEENKNKLSATQIIALGKEILAYEANRIAITENNRIAQFVALYLSTKLSEKGYTITKTWRAVIDANTCPMCESLNGKTIGYHEYFLKDGESYGGVVYGYTDSIAAVAHPNCRCTIEINVK